MRLFDNEAEEGSAEHEEIDDDSARGSDSEQQGSQEAAGDTSDDSELQDNVSHEGYGSEADADSEQDSEEGTDSSDADEDEGHGLQGSSSSGEDNDDEDGGMTKLHIAAEQGLADLAVQLLQQDEDVDAVTASNWLTPSHLAAAWGHLPVLQLLAEAGADLGVATSWQAGSNTVLHVAALNDFPEVVEFLLQQPGVDVWVENSRGFCPLVLAAREGHTRVVQQLLASVPPGTTDGDVRGALSQAAYYAVKYRHADVLPPLLLRLGPDFTDGAWFQEARERNFEDEAFQAVVEAWRLSLASKPLSQEWAELRAAKDRARREAAEQRLGIQQLLVQSAVVVRHALRLQEQKQEHAQAAEAGSKQHKKKRKQHKGADATRPEQQVQQQPEQAVGERSKRRKKKHHQQASQSSGQQEQQQQHHHEQQPGGTTEPSSKQMKEDKQQPSQETAQVGSLQLEGGTNHKKRGKRKKKLLQHAGQTPEQQQQQQQHGSDTPAGKMEQSSERRQQAAEDAPDQGQLQPTSSKKRKRQEAAATTGAEGQGAGGPARNGLPVAAHGRKKHKNSGSKQHAAAN